MKQTILFFLAALVATACTVSRSKLEDRAGVFPYPTYLRPIVDSAAYLRAIVEPRSPYYAGKPLKLMFDELEVTVRSASLPPSVFYRYKGRSVYKTVTLGFGEYGYKFFHPGDTIPYAVMGGFGAKTRPTVLVEFAPPFLEARRVDDLLKKSGGEVWTPEIRKIIEKVKVRRVTFSPNIQPKDDKKVISK